MTCHKGNPFYNPPRPHGAAPRWVATIVYRTDAGPVDVEHQFAELDMLHDIVERGPSFYTIEKIEVRIARPSTLTIEGALAQ